MDILQTLKDIGERSSGEVFLGVVGPVRVGKSTFIKKFIECVVLDNIPSSEDKKRTMHIVITVIVLSVSRISIPKCR